MEVDASAPGRFRNTRMKQERGSCGTRCSRTSACRQDARSASGRLIGSETKRPTGVARPTGPRNAHFTYSYPKRALARVPPIVWLHAVGTASLWIVGARG